MAKSITALVFGRAMTQNLIGPDDPLGSLIPPADAAHGAITMRHLLTMTSGLQWNGLRDYNITHARPDQRGADGSGRQEAGHLLGVLAERPRAGRRGDPERGRRRLPGLRPAASSSDRSGSRTAAGAGSATNAGHTQGFFGVHMTPDDYARFGELMRLGGVWQGKRLLSKRFVREAITPVAQSGCYGWFIWVNASKPCVSPRVVDRPVSDEQHVPDAAGRRLPIRRALRPARHRLPQPGPRRRPLRQRQRQLRRRRRRGRRSSTTACWPRSPTSRSRCPKPEPDAERRQPRGRRPRLLRGRPAPGRGRRRRSSRRRFRRRARRAPARP